MDRRKFLGSLLAIPGLAVLPKSVNFGPSIPVQWPQTQLSDELKGDIIVKIEASVDGKNWQEIGNATNLGVTGRRDSLDIAPDGTLYINGDFVYGTKDYRYDFETQSWKSIH